MKEWFALHTKPYAERKVAVRLEHHDIETFVPETESRSERANSRPVPFFPGYMFIRVDMEEANPIHWRTAPGVRHVVSYGNEPAPVDEALIRTIRHQLEARAGQRQPQARFAPGDQVRILSGPFEDMVAVFDGPMEPSERVHVLLEMMARLRRVRVAAADLEKVDSDEQKPKGKRPRRTRGRGRPIRS